MGTIKELLAWARTVLMKSSDSPGLDAEVLLAHVLGVSRSHLVAWPAKKPAPRQRADFEALVSERSRGVPIAYLVGHREFWSRDFSVTPAVLIPRPETELLVEIALTMMPDEELSVADLGTGSGAIAVTLGLERPRARITAVDASPDALVVAIGNARRLHAENVRFVQGHWLEAFAGERFDLVVSNPPYVAEGDPHLSEGDVRFEPASALISGDAGLADISAIAHQALRCLIADGHLILEHGYDQADTVAALLHGIGYREIHHHRDLLGHRRTTSARAPGPGESG